MPYDGRIGIIFDMALTHESKKLYLELLNYNICDLLGRLEDFSHNNRQLTWKQETGIGIWFDTRATAYRTLHACIFRLHLLVSSFSNV